MKLSSLTQKGETINEETTERGSIEKMRILCDWVTDSNKKIYESLNNKDIRMARLFIRELSGYIDQLEEHANLLSSDIGLPTIK